MQSCFSYVIYSGLPFLFSSHDLPLLEFKCTVFWIPVLTWHMFSGNALIVYICVGPDLLRRKCFHFLTSQERDAANSIQAQAKVLRRVSLCTCSIRETRISSMAAPYSAVWVCPLSLPRPERMDFKTAPSLSFL